MAKVEKVICSRAQCGCVRERVGGFLTYHYPEGGGLTVLCRERGHAWVSPGQHYSDVVHGPANLTPDDEAAIAKLLGRDQP